MKIVIGLGNPGSTYDKTRHNVGWRVLDMLATQFGGSLSFEKKFNAEIATVMIDSEKVLLVKPQTFMNNSGESARPVMDFYKVEAANVIAVYDDKDIAYGTVRLRSSGSAAGHNGVKSLIAHMGGQEFPRVRVGVADPESPITDTADFVLARFTAEEEKQMDDVLTAGVRGVLDIVRNGINPQSHADIVAL